MKMKLLRLSIAMLIIVGIAVLPQTSAFALPDLQEAETTDTRNYDKWLPSSLNIELPNVNMNLVQDDRIIEEWEADEAVRFGKSKSEAIKMTRSELISFINSRKLTNESRKHVATMFPELSAEEIAGMTYAAYENYAVNKSKSRYVPDEETLNKIKLRGITKEDFVYLRKFYYEDSNILAQSDDVLRDILKEWYMMKLDYASLVSSDSEYKRVLNSLSDDDVAGITREDPANTALYTKVAHFNNYSPDYDWFLLTAKTHFSNYRSYQEDLALKAFNLIYARPATNTTANFTNLYGTYSQSQHGAHEGIDMVYSSTPDVHTITSGTAYNYSTYNGATRIYNSTYGSAIYAHMTNRVTSGSVSAGGVIGKQGQEGNATGKHVHFEIGTSMHDEDDDVLGSSSPYLFVHNYLGHNPPNTWNNYGDPVKHRGVCKFPECSAYVYDYHIPNAAGNKCTVCGYTGTIVGPV